MPCDVTWDCPKGTPRESHEMSRGTQKCLKGIPWGPIGGHNEQPSWVSRKNSTRCRHGTPNLSQGHPMGVTWDCLMGIPSESREISHRTPNISQRNPMGSHGNFRGMPSGYLTGTPWDVTWDSTNVSKESHRMPSDVTWDLPTDIQWESHEMSHRTPNTSQGNPMGSRGMLHETA